MAPLATGCVVAVLLATGGAACAPLIRSSTQAGLEGSLETLSEPQNQARLEAIATSDEVQESTEELTASVTQGVVKGLKQEIAGEDAAPGRPLADSLGERTGGVVRTHVAPAMATVVERTVDASLAAASSDVALARTRKIVLATTDAAVEGFTLALGRRLQDDIGPALQDWEPIAVRVLGNPGFRQAVGGLVHEMTRQAVLGSEGAIDTIQKKQDANHDGEFFGGLGGMISLGWAGMVALAIGLSIAFVALAVLVVKGNAQRRHLERDNRQREEMMFRFMQVLATAPGGLTPEQRDHAERLGLAPEPPPGPAPAPERRPSRQRR